MRGLVDVDTRKLAAKMAVIEKAIEEARLLSNQCNVSDIRLCQPEPACDAHGRQPQRSTQMDRSLRS
jgi:hypothetical protein